MTELPSDDKARSKSVSLVPSLWEKIEHKAATEFGGNRSEYFRQLAEDDLAGKVQEAAPTSPHILDELARGVAPTAAGAFSAWKDQPEILAAILQALAHVARHTPDWRPEAIKAVFPDAKTPSIAVEFSTTGQPISLIRTLPASGQASGTSQASGTLQGSTAAAESHQAPAPRKTARRVTARLAQDAPSQADSTQAGRQEKQA